MNILFIIDNRRLFMSNKKLLLRSEVLTELTWDLSTIYPNDDAFEKSFKEIENLVTNFSKHESTLTKNVDYLFNALEDRNTLLMKMESLYVYSHLKSDQDTSDATYQALNARASALYSKVAASLSFIETNLLKVNEEVIRSYLEDDRLSIYETEFNHLFERRKHILSDKEEKLLALASDVLSASSKTFGVLNNADLTFKDVVNELGEALPLSHGRYGLYLESSDRQLRQHAFESMYASFKAYENTFASTLSHSVKLHNFSASIRNFTSAREAALFTNHIPESVYDALVKAVNDQLGYLHKWVSLRKKALKLNEIKMYDLYVPMVNDLDLEFSYDQSKEIILKAFEPLGKDYLKGIQQAFDSRWIDVMENKGKRSGAYSSGGYTTSPYILLNWQDNLDNLYTLAHELGHSMHSYYSRQNQPFIYGDYSIFVAEVASTTNENLLTAYLLKTSDDPKVKAYLLNHYCDGVKGTVYRQTQFAEFEHLIHTLDQEGVALTSELLNAKYDEMNRRYYGDEVSYSEEIKSEWSRIPHFYYNYYVYQYATGFSAASTLSEKILTEGQFAVNNYISFLKAGSSLKPIEALKVAGVDMSKDEAIKKALNLFGQRLDELEQLLSI